MSTLDSVHGQWVHPRRLRVLAARFAGLVPQGASVLDVGCGDGQLARLIQERRPDVRLSGIDVLVRPGCAIPVQAFDGRNIPHRKASFDLVLMADVLHHTEDPMLLLRESVRVARQGLLLKDHLCEGWLGRPTLCFMDWVGNRRHGVALPYNYWDLTQWEKAFATLSLKTAAWESRLGLYPWPASLLFERSLHFLALLLVPGG